MTRYFQKNTFVFISEFYVPFSDGKLACFNFNNLYSTRQHADTKILFNIFQYMQHDSTVKNASKKGIDPGQKTELLKKIKRRNSVIN